MKGEYIYAAILFVIGVGGIVHSIFTVGDVAGVEAVVGGVVAALGVRHAYFTKHPEDR